MADGMHLQLTGIAELERALAKGGEHAIRALAAAMVTEQEQVITEAKQRTPVDTGTLRASGTVLPPQIDGTKIEVTAGFGGAAQDYAIPVHERMGVHHPVGQSKFLESAFLERVPKMASKLAANVLAAWQRLAVR